MRCSRTLSESLPSVEAALRDYVLSDNAIVDLIGIFIYGTDLFGLARANRYRADLLKTVELLAERPLLGRSAERAGAALRRQPFGSHVIFYTPTEDGIVVERVLHMSVLRGISLDDRQS
jgi:toxin ParE1/3/4